MCQHVLLCIQQCVFNLVFNVRFEALECVQCTVSYSPTRGGRFPQARIPLSSKLKLELPAMNVMQVLKSLIRTESSSSRDMVTICGPVWKSVPVSIHRVCKFWIPFNHCYNIHKSTAYKGWQSEQFPAHWVSTKDTGFCWDSGSVNDNTHTGFQYMTSQTKTIKKPSFAVMLYDFDPIFEHCQLCGSAFPHKNKPRNRSRAKLCESPELARSSTARKSGSEARSNGRIPPAAWMEMINTRCQKQVQTCRTLSEFVVKM